MKKFLAVLILSFFSVSLALADGEKVLKVYIFKAKKLQEKPKEEPPSMDLDGEELAAPTDQELAAARKAIGEMGIKPEDLKQENQVLPLELFLLEVKKAYPDQKYDEKDKVNGILVEKPSAEELDDRRKVLKVFQDLRHFARHFEAQMDLGVVLPLSPGFSRAYQPAASFGLGLGYQFFDFFDLLVNFDYSSFQSNNDAITGGSRYEQFDLALLAKFRLAPSGIRPYFYGGPAVSRGSFSLDYTTGGFDANTTLRDQSNFMALAGVGVEIPVGKRMHLFLQGQMNFNFLPAVSQNFEGLDAQTQLLPIQAGIVFGR